ncbi:PREDICTED: uncharacterized protein LOC104613322 [Nelumbo nucifera]|uniref:Uncharacterized protein LOC104613322 n=2 Tax=Nelumbo nucifera TaxID=4432 RepID=A0A1U8BQ58_NELNU|nr:PREDICTED: uncharacterized protein LOC104613322 [Nelumbo nucifera]DAD31913.1 TPA_asm: hypothetical protein HUJ06_010764 [Nelumbo nucifera]
MKEEKLDVILVPLGLLVMAMYNGWLLITILRTPTRTAIGLNAVSRQQWVISMMADPAHNGMLAVQTIRNSIMASALLATTAITLCSIIGVIVNNLLVHGSSKTYSLFYTVKYLAILLCFFVAFICNVQSIRHYAHVSYLVTIPALKDRIDSIAYMATSLNWGCYFWFLGLRAFYISFPLFLWNFGAIPMFACCCLMPCIQYFLDTTTSLTRSLHGSCFGEGMVRMDDVESSTHPPLLSRTCNIVY